MAGITKAPNAAAATVERIKESFTVTPFSAEKCSKELSICGMPAL
jgi:hypothetical protein